MQEEPSQTQSGTPGRRGAGSLGSRGWGWKYLQPPPPPACLPRLLEADSKSMRSMNGSRAEQRLLALVSSSSASSNLSHLEEDTWFCGAGLPMSGRSGAEGEAAEGGGDCGAGQAGWWLGAGKGPGLEVCQAEEERRREGGRGWRPRHPRLLPTCVLRDRLEHCGTLCHEVA